MAEDTRAIAQSVKTSDSQTKHPCPTGQHNLYKHNSCPTGQHNLYKHNSCPTGQHNSYKHNSCPIAQDT